MLILNKCRIKIQFYWPSKLNLPRIFLDGLFQKKICSSLCDGENLAFIRDNHMLDLSERSEVHPREAGRSHYSRDVGAALRG